MKLLFVLFLALGSVGMHGQDLSYPYPVSYHYLGIEGKKARMAFMDVRAAKPNGETVLLFHGKNFNGYYWKEVVAFLAGGGYRVIVPDQVGWGLSDKPDIHYSFHLLASNTIQLLDSLGIVKVHVVGHSMGGMLATRFTLMYPDRVNKLILENPIGLEDYKTFIPYRTVEEQYVTEAKAGYESLKKYQQSYYPKWKEEYEPLVRAQEAAFHIPDTATAAWANALTYQMIYEQPVVYEFKNIKKPTLLIIGQEDRTVVGKNLLSQEDVKKHGNYPQLGRWLQSQIAGSRLKELPGVGHIPHIQVPEVFEKEVLGFLKKK